MSETLFATPLNPEDPYDLASVVEPVRALRIASVGDLIAIPVNIGHVGPFVVERCDEKFIAVSDPTWKPEPRWSFIRLNFIECQSHIEGWFAPELIPPLAVIPNHYGEMWVFEEEANYATDFDQQLLAVRRRYIGLFGEPLKTPKDESHIPKCPSCRVWPCEKQSSCPDWEKLSQGRIWDHTRFLTPEESMEKYKC